MNLETIFQYFLKLQNNFNKTMSDQIFGSLSDHLYAKWMKCDNNILNFLSRLDQVNRQKLFNFAKTHNNTSFPMNHLL